MNRFDEAEPLEQLSKLDVVVGNGAEQENQLESAHAHSLFFVLGSAEQSTREAQGFVFLLRVLRLLWNGELERPDRLGDSREDWAVVGGERGVAGFLAGVFGWGRVYLSILLDDFKGTCSET